MNKKGIIALVVIIILVVLGYMAWGGKGSTTVGNPAAGAPSTATGATPGASADSFAPVTKDSTDTTLLGRLKSASVQAAETGSRVALVDGKAQFSTDGVKGSIALGDVAVSKTIAGANYVVTTLGVETNGATAQYAVLFTDANGALADQSYDLIGSGATVTGIRADEVSGGMAVTVSYNDASGAAHKKIIVVENGAFDPAKDINL